MDGWRRHFARGIRVAMRSLCLELVLVAVIVFDADTAVGFEEHIFSMRQRILRKRSPTIIENSSMMLTAPKSARWLSSTKSLSSELRKRITASEMEDIDVKSAEDGANVMEVLEKNLNDLEDNSKTLLESIEQLNLRSDCYLDELTAEISKLEENVENTLEMFDAKCYIKEREEELQKLKTELDDQKNVVGNLRNELNEAKSTLFHQSSYTASLGATLCTLLWSACGDKLIAVELLKQKRLVDLLGMIPDSLRSFFESFGENLPNVQSKEYQFILSMIGIVTNISAVSEGRTFLANCQEGDRIIRELLEVVFKIPQSGVHIQRTVLMVLYNMSLDKSGIRIIRNDARILPFLVRKISQADGKLRYVSLRLFQSLAYHVKNVDFVETLHKTIHSIKLEELQQYCKNNEKDIIAQIIANIDSARHYLQSEPGANGTPSGF